MRHPADAVTWYPYVELIAEGISLQRLTNLIWSVCSRNSPFAERDTLLIVLGSLMYYIFTRIESHLQFIALTSEMISLSRFTVAHCLLFLPVMASQLQTQGSQTQHRCHPSSARHLTSSFSYLKNYCYGQLLIFIFSVLEEKGEERCALHAECVQAQGMKESRA